MMNEVVMGNVVMENGFDRTTSAGRRLGAALLVACGVCFGSVAAEPQPDCKTLENATWKLEFNPLGGRVRSLYSKVFGFELTTPNHLGSFREEEWKRRESREFLMKKPFLMEYLPVSDGRIEVRATGQAEGGGINFLKIEKTYRADPDSASFYVDYRFNNTPEAMALQNYAPLLQAALGLCDHEVTCFYPSTEGIDVRESGKRGNEYWGTHVSRGWMAAATPDTGTGAALVMPFRDVSAFYSWFDQTPSMEWRMIPVGIEEGGHYDVRVEVIPFTGVYPVSGAGNGFVGSLDKGTCKIVSSRACTAEANGRRLVFAKPGDSQSFATDETTVVITVDGKEMCRLEGRPATGEWVIKPEGEPRTSAIKEADLSAYTNYVHQTVDAWAKPLAGGRLKVAFLTGSHGANAELGEFLDRVDIDARVMPCGIGAGYSDKRSLHNPIFSDGDNFCLVNEGDVERGILQVLRFDADVIAVCGLPWEMLPKEAKKIILTKVKQGVGLVWVGQDRNVPELGFSLVPKSRAEKLAPTGVGEAFASVPFGILGAEPVLPVALPKDAVVHATCKDRPYLYETRLGKGAFLNLTYLALTSQPWPHASFTPAWLADFYETRKLPVEAYYSLFAKALMRAAGRVQPVTLGKADVTAAQARVLATVRRPMTAKVAWKVRDAFGEAVRAGETSVALSAGATEVALDLKGVPARQGALVLEAQFRTASGEVLDWGAWAFENAPKATIADFTVDSMWHEEGETLVYTLAAGGDLADAKARFSLVDSYGRTLAVKEVPAAARLEGGFQLENDLPARCNTLVAELVDAAGDAFARWQKEVRIRPADAKMAWDDFEVGTWACDAQRAYLWPRLGEIYRELGITTLIANPYRIETDFAMRHNVNPTYLGSSGLSRTPEPKEYAETGDKMKLVRGTCLSSPRFLEGREKELARFLPNFRRFGFRYVWFGDEQSITGYGGNPIDFCFSEHCLKEMRAFVRGKYGTLERLNEEWETAFRTWDEVVPFTRQEVWEANGRHVAGWADHLEFMDDRLTNTLAISVNALRKVDPNCRYSISGTQPPSAYGGTDYWKQMGTLDALLNYGSGGQFDILRSFRPDGGFTPWVWGYAGQGPGVRRGPWQAAFVGSRGLMGFQQSSQINSDWTWSKGLRDSLPAIRRLVEGTGMHFVQNLVTRREIAILYSQASFRAAFIENRRKDHEALEEKVRTVLTRLGYSYEYVSYEQLAKGVLAERGYKMLVLPDSIALGDAEIAAIDAYAKTGRPVIGLGEIARRTQNCRLRTQPTAVRYADFTEADAAAWDRAVVAAGVVNSRLTLAAAKDGKALDETDIYAKADRAGNPVWCVLPAPKMRPVETRFTFPKEGYVYDLVSGRAFGRVKEVVQPFDVGTPYAFALFPEPVELAAKAEGTTVSLAYSQPVDGVVRLSVFRPDGTQATCYARNVPVKAGKGAWKVPFCLSDAAGTWRVEASSIFGNMRATVEIRNRE